MAPDPDADPDAESPPESGARSDTGSVGDRETAPGAPRTTAAVRDTYDRIAGHFSATRAHPWPEVESFLAGRSGGVGLDVGCGNGRHAVPLARRVDRAVGVDVSRRLLREARERAAEAGTPVALLGGDAAALPVRTGTVDLAVYVATLHHLPDRGRRVASLDELARVLAPGGAALVSAWSTTHERFADRVPGAGAGGGDGDGFDTTVDWTLPDGTTVPRFYHIYDPEEFRADVAASRLDGETYVSSGNCYAEVRAPR